MVITNHGNRESMKRNIVEALIGAAVLVVAAGFFYTTYKTTDFGTVNGYELVAKFDKVDGLAVGSDVRMSGIKVGTVVTQEVDPETYQAIVVLSVRPDIRLPEDSSVSVSSENLFGGSYLALTPGGMDEYLEAGDEIEFTEGAVNLIDLVSEEIFSPDDDNGNGDSE